MRVCVDRSGELPGSPSVIASAHHALDTYVRMQQYERLSQLQRDFDVGVFEVLDYFHHLGFRGRKGRGGKGASEMRGEEYIDEKMIRV
jgi:hypothetical protein